MNYRVWRGKDGAVEERAPELEGRYVALLDGSALDFVPAILFNPFDEQFAVLV